MLLDALSGFATSTRGQVSVRGIYTTAIPTTKTDYSCSQAFRMDRFIAAITDIDPRSTDSFSFQYSFNPQGESSCSPIQQNLN